VVLTLAVDNPNFPPKEKAWNKLQKEQFHGEVHGVTAGRVKTSKGPAMRLKAPLACERKAT
jgi:hypothetical protein